MSVSSIAAIPVRAVFARDHVRRPTAPWLALCVFLVLPFTAVLHHAGFLAQTCILNNFGPDYTPAVVSRWLTQDPSLWVAMLLAMLVYRIGLEFPQIRRPALAFGVGFLPLSIWVWDIPFTGRWVCNTLHDGQLQLLGFVVRGAFLYAIGAALLGVSALPLVGEIWNGVSSRVRGRVEGAAQGA